MTDDYEAAIREWIARKIRSRGHKDYTRADIRNIRYDIDEGFTGTDVTPGDDPVAGLVCEIRYTPRTGNHWHEHAESLEHITPVELIQECLAIHAELQAKP